MSRRPGSVMRRLAVAVGALAIVAWAYHYMDLLGDSFWYAAVGRWILAHRALPAQDPFAFTTAATAWTVHMPLAQVLFGWTEVHLGLHALLVGASVVFGGAVALAWAAGARRPASRLLLLPLALFVVWLQRDDLAARGQVFGDLFFVLVMLLVRRCQLAKLSAPAAAGLGFVISAVWLELHSSALVAPLMALGYAAALHVEGGARAASTRSLLALAAGLGAGLLVSPSGPGVLALDVLRLAASPSTHSIDLFQSPDFRDAGVLAALALAALTASTAGRADALMLLAWVVGSCLARRHLELLSLATLFVAGRTLDRANVDRWLPRAALVNLAALFLVPLAWTTKDPLQNVPADAAAFVASQHLTANVMNPYHWGGYLDDVWFGSPRVFIDGRNQLFDNGVFDDHRSIARGDAEARLLLDVYEIETVLWERDTPLDVLLANDPGWQEVFRGRLAAVYVRRPKRP
ncbi:MAG: hypothetical protein JWP97_347 [Labilithrix sp.]|nr:hypothetical protein [Labilithrix sp.]